MDAAKEQSYCASNIIFQRQLSHLPVVCRSSRLAPNNITIPLDNNNNNNNKNIAGQSRTRGPNEFILEKEDTPTQRP